LINLSFGGIGQYLIATSSWIGLVRIISLFGPVALAGYTIAIRIVIFALLPSIGISNAAATLVGQNLGALQPDRAEQSAWMTGTVNLILLGTIGLFLVAFPGYFIALFVNDPAIIQNGAVSLRIISYGFLAYGFGMVMVHSINGAGDTITPTKINFVCFWLIEIPLAYILSITFKMEEKGVFYAIFIAETIMAVAAFVIFKRGKWKLSKV
jgi:Na+-driven multidrug efflux pump